MLPNLKPAPRSLGGINLPELESYQEWAINLDTNQLVLVEFPGLKQPPSGNIQAVTQDSVNTLNTILQQSNALVSDEIISLQTRISSLENIVTTITSS